MISWEITAIEYWEEEKNQAIVRNYKSKQEDEIETFFFSLFFSFLLLTSY